VTRITEGFNRFVTSTIAPVASGWSICRVGLTPTGKRHLFTAHTRLGPHACILQLASPQGMSADAFDLDNNFAGWSRSATIAWPDEARAVTLKADAPFDHMVLYAPAGEPSLLCVEPVTNTVDWINLDAPVQHKGGCVLAPGESVSASFAWLPSR
jgi:aldose 1-epimerase